MNNRVEVMLIGSPLRKRRYAIAVLVLLGTLLVLALTQLLRQFNVASDVLRVMSGALLVTTLLSLIPVTVIRFLDRRERESFWVTIIAFLWGGVIATGLSLPLNTQIITSIASTISTNEELLRMLGPNAPILLGAPIAGPLVEETMKALGVLVLFILLRGEFDNMRDGFVYGALVGVGFTWFEAALYLTNGYARCGEIPWGLQIGSRYALFGMAGHVLYTGIFGMFLGLARQTTARWLTITAPVIGLLIAIGAHMIHNALPLLFSISAAVADPTGGAAVDPNSTLCAPAAPILSSLAMFSIFDLILFAPALIIVGLGLWRSGIWERRVIRQQLKDEPADIVTPDEYAQIEADGTFRTRRIFAEKQDRKRMRAVVNAQNEIAFRKHRLRRKGKDPEQDFAVKTWRSFVRESRQG